MSKGRSYNGSVKKNELVELIKNLHRDGNPPSMIRYENLKPMDYPSVYQIFHYFFPEESTSYKDLSMVHREWANLMFTLFGKRPLEGVQYGPDRDLRFDDIPLPYGFKPDMKKHTWWGLSAFERPTEVREYLRRNRKTGQVQKMIAEYRMIR